jgi:hypothetical protein
MTTGRKLLALAGIAATVGLGGCAQLMPRLGLAAPGGCGNGGMAYSAAAPWRAPRANILSVRQQLAFTSAHYSFGYNEMAFNQAIGAKLGMGECPLLQQ